MVATEAGTRSTGDQYRWHPDNRLPASMELFHDAVGELVEAAERHSSILALEGSVRHVLPTHAALAGVLDRFPSRSLQVVLDPYNYLARAMLPAAERVTRDFLDRFEHRFVLAHLKDVSDDGAEAETPEFGTGTFPQHVYVEFLAERRPDLPLVLEHLPLDNVAAAAGRVLAAAPMSLADAEARAARRRGEHRPQPLLVSALAEDRIIAGVPARVLTPPDVRGVYLHLHGGGFVFGSSRLQDDRLEALAVACRVAVVSVEYRLAPEDPYPAGPDDCEAALAIRLAESGDRHLHRRRVRRREPRGRHAAATAGPPRLHRLPRGRRSSRASTTFRSRMRRETGDPGLSRADLEALVGEYAGAHGRADPDLSPVNGVLDGLPPALIAVGALDPLLDDSRELAERWLAAGNDAELAVFPNAGHELEPAERLHSFVASRLDA